MNRSNLHRSLVSLNSVCLDPGGQFWRMRHSQFAQFEPRPARAICRQCGAELVSSEDDRSCPTHGPQERYLVVAANGAQYAADGREAQ